MYIYYMYADCKGTLLTSTACYYRMNVKSQQESDVQMHS